MALRPKARTNQSHHSSRKHRPFLRTMDRRKCPRSAIASLNDLCIQHCLFYPDKRINPKPSIDFDTSFSLNFAPPDFKRYPCLELAYQALKQEPYGGAIYNAANEIAVQRFIAEEISFTDIAKIIETALNNIPIPETHSLASLLQIDQDTRDFALKLDPKKL